MGGGITSSSGAKYKEILQKRHLQESELLTLIILNFYKIKFIAGHEMNPKMTTDTTIGLIS